LLTGRITAVPEEELAQESLSSRPALANVGFQPPPLPGQKPPPHSQSFIDLSKSTDGKLEESSPAQNNVVSWEPQFILQEPKMKELADKVVSKYGCSIDAKTLRQFAATLQCHVSDILEVSLVASKRRRDASVHKHYVNLSTVLSPATAHYLHSLAAADAGGSEEHSMNSLDIARGNAGLKWGPDIRGLLTEEATQQAEVVAAAKIALEESLLAELREAEEVARKKGKKNVVGGGTEVAEVSHVHLS